jgi:hypothetical protein
VAVARMSNRRQQYVTHLPLFGHNPQSALFKSLFVLKVQQLELFSSSNEMGCDLS